MNLQSHVPLRKCVSLNLPAQSFLLVNTDYTGNTHPRLIGLLNRNFVISAIQDFLLNFIKLLKPKF